MRRILAIYGKMKGSGRLRRNELLYKGPIPPDAAVNIAKWWLAAKDAEEKERA
jgi:hypothetical protein